MESIEKERRRMVRDRERSECRDSGSPLPHCVALLSRLRAREATLGRRLIASVRRSLNLSAATIIYPRNHIVHALSPQQRAFRFHVQSSNHYPTTRAFDNNTTQTTQLLLFQQRYYIYTHLYTYMRGPRCRSVLSNVRDETGKG